jgi:hypothetical protein
MVLTATGNYAYKREDGILVVPIGCLKDWEYKLTNFWKFCVNIEFFCNNLTLKCKIVIDWGFILWYH